METSIKSGMMQAVNRMHRMSRLYMPVERFESSKSKSANLLISKGLMKPLEQGTFFYMPMLQRAVHRTSGVIKRFMFKANAEEIAIPALAPNRLWKESGRFESFKDNLFTMEGKSQLLGPTFEESITHLMSYGDGVPEKCLPLRFFQIGTKFRDETDPKHGLLRTREFIMKDMYTFDLDKTSAMETYEEMNDIYTRLFKFIGVPFVKVEADATSMGGTASQEYHYLSEIGEGKLHTCQACNHSVERSDEDNNLNECHKCKSKNLAQRNGIEIGHTFYLGDTYSRRQKALARSSRTPLEMGCYGIGVTRLIGASVEALSTDTHIRWPIPLAPYLATIIMPEKRSKAFKLASHHLDELHTQLNGLSAFNDSILVDDRIRIPIGERVREARGLGIPLIIIIGKSACDPNDVKFELYFTYEDKTVFLSLDQLITEARDYIATKLDENV